jgi:dinuclear metal center YbgI/SA1388 family protein
MAAKPKNPTLAQLIGLIEKMAPTALAESYDNVGLQIGDRSKTVRRLMVALEVTDRVIDEAKRRRADTLVVHHPLFFLPIKRLDESDLVGHLAQRLVREGIALIAAHTNLDKSPEGTNAALAEKLGLTDTEVLLPESVGRQFKYAVFVPEGHERAVIEAISNAGGGIIGNYDHCTFRTPGTGTFRGGEGTKPAVGQAGRFEEAQEVRLEAVIPQSALTRVIEDVKAVHPYEEVAFDVYSLEMPPGPWGLGLRAKLAKPMTLRAWAHHIKRRLKLKAVRVVGKEGAAIRTVAIATGSCEMLVRQFAPPHVDCLVTGDVKYHIAVEARAKGLAVVDPGHWASEVIVTEPLCQSITDRLRAHGWMAEVIPSTDQDPDPFVTL